MANYPERSRGPCPAFTTMTFPRSAGAAPRSAAGVFDTGSQGLQNLETYPRSGWLSCLTGGACMARRSDHGACVSRSGAFHFCLKLMTILQTAILV
jgi:hypothetical protein